MSVDPALKPVVDDLIRETEQLAAVFRGISDMTAKAKTVQAELDTTIAREKPLNASIQAFCQAK